MVASSQAPLPNLKVPYYVSYYSVSELSRNESYTSFACYPFQKVCDKTLSYRNLPFVMSQDRLVVALLLSQQRITFNRELKPSLLLEAVNRGQMMLFSTYLYSVLDNSAYKTAPLESKVV